jgi:diguanylate cyclase (GGDEF)-like protein/PAS domain S-box-containing protein
VIGVINISDDRQSGPFSTEEIRLASLFADQAAIAVERARLLEAAQQELAERKKVEHLLLLSNQSLQESEQCARDLFDKAQRQTQELALLEQVTSALARQVELPEILRTVVEAAANTLDYPMVSIYMVEDGMLVIRHHHGYSQIYERIPLGRGVMSRAVLSEKPVWVEDVSADQDFLGIAPGLVSEVAVPLFCGGQVVGVLNVESTGGSKLGEDDLRLITRLSEHINIAFDRARLYEGLRQSEERFRKIFEESSLGLALIDPQYRFIQVNPALCDGLGFSKPELAGREIADFCPVEDAAATVDLARRLFSGEIEKIDTEMRYVRINGEILWGHLIASLHRGEQGETRFIMALIEDISLRKQAEVAEREQRELAEALRDTAAALNSTLHLEEVLRRILTNIGRVVPHENANIMLVKDGVAYVVDRAGYLERGSDEYISSLRLNMMETPSLRWMHESGRPLIIPDTRDHPEWTGTLETTWIRSYAAAPIRVKGETAGFLNLNSSSVNYFTESHGERLLAFADQAAVAIENARLFGEVQRSARRMALLNQIIQVSIQAPDLNTLLQTLAGRLGELFDAEGAYLTRWDEDLKLAVPAAVFGPLSEIYLTLKGQPGERSMTASVLKEERVLVAEDVLNNPYISPEIAGIYPARSMLGIPLIADGRKLGAALIHYKEPHHFTAEDIALGEQVSGQISLAVAKVLALDAERQHAAQLKRANSMVMALSRVAAAIEKAANVDGVLETLGIELKKLDINCLVLQQDDHPGGLVHRFLSINPKDIHQAEKLTGSNWSTYRFSVELYPFLYEVLNQRQAVFSNNSIRLLVHVLTGMPRVVSQQLSDLFQFTAETSSIILPLAAEEKAIGVLWLWGKDLERNDLPSASLFASQVAVAMENAHLYAQAQRFAVTDELTEAYNRRGLFELGQREVQRSLRYGHSLSLLILDIDHFKSLNDRFGHLVGDQILRTLARRCRRRIRQLDIFGRYGGDEFIFIFPETDLDAAYLVGERLRRAIVDTAIETDAGPVKISVSLGVSAINGRCLDLEGLIDLADKALFQAKDAGRNCVVAK